MNEPKTQDLVRQEYKRYKRKKPPPDFTEVIDVRKFEKFADKVERYKPRPQNLASDSCARPAEYCNIGLKDPEQWEVYHLKSCPGLIFIKNPFLPHAQKYWTQKALTDYTRKPFPCNLDVHMELDPDKTVWEISKDENPSCPYTFMEKLRWTHLGYHFDYNYVNYKEEKYYGFPDDLSMLMKSIAKGLGFEDYSPETAIINYYPVGSSMGGHTDHYEEELDAPLLSVSFGQPAVFLIGGKTKDIKPEAIWIRSGDLIVMAGESRIAFHAVPCIIKEGKEGIPPLELRFEQENIIANDFVKDINKDVADHAFQAGFEGNCENNSRCCPEQIGHFWMNSNMTQKEWQPFEDYLSRTRVNINVRQVHKKQQKVSIATYMTD